VKYSHITFGCDHLFGDSYVTFINESDDEWQPKQWMLKTFGRNWCSEYSGARPAKGSLNGSYKQLAVVHFDKHCAATVSKPKEKENDGT